MIQDRRVIFSYDISIFSYNIEYQSNSSRLLKLNMHLYFSAFLVKYLEKRSCELNFDQSWVFQMMMEVGVSLSKLHEIYDRLFKSKVSIEGNY